MNFLASRTISDPVSAELAIIGSLGQRRTFELLGSQGRGDNRGAGDAFDRLNAPIPSRERFEKARIAEIGSTVKLTRIIDRNRPDEIEQLRFLQIGEAARGVVSVEPDQQPTEQCDSGH